MNNALKIKKAKSVFEGQPNHGWVWVNAESKEEANQIVEDALNAHPDIKCDWVEVAFVDTNNTQGSDKATIYYHHDLMDIDDALRELWGCR